MVSERFQPGGTSVGPTEPVLVRLTAGLPRRGPTVAVACPAFSVSTEPKRSVSTEPKRSQAGVAHDLRVASRPVQKQPRMSRSAAMSLHLPPSRYPAPTPVIQASTEADLQNRQGHCLRNSSVRIVPVGDNRLFPRAIMPTRKWILRSKWAVTTLRSGAAEDRAEKHEEGSAGS